jgi:hypothetical protein
MNSYVSNKWDYSLEYTKKWLESACKWKQRSYFQKDVAASYVPPFMHTWGIFTGDAFQKVIIVFMAMLSTLVRLLSMKRCVYYARRLDPRFHCQQWIFKSYGLHQHRSLRCTHKVVAKHQLCKMISITVDDNEHDVIVWEQSVLDLLDFGGKFRFTVTSPECIEDHGEENAKPVVHHCFIMIHPWHMKLYVDGVNVESGKRYIPSTFRLMIRLITVLMCFLIFSFSFKSS